MTRTRDHAFLVLLAFLGLYIWVRDLSWLDNAHDTWPILAGIPLFLGLTRPWSFARLETPPPVSQHVAVGVAFFLAGVLLDLAFLLALAWTCLLWAWIAARIPAGQARQATAKKLLALPLLSFPWIAADLHSLGWIFRLTGAAAAEQFFALLHFDVLRQGTHLWVGGDAISVDAACSGLNGLQAIFIAGTTLAYLKLKDSRRYWWSFPILFGAAWLANTLRIVMLALFSVQTDWNISNGLVHALAGWLALCLAFGICWFIFTFQEQGSRWKEFPQHG
ncbi:MAG: archaeosortase/exosortase family protein [Verrucomicrobiota bacterium]